MLQWFYSSYCFTFYAFRHFKMHYVRFFSEEGDATQDQY